jgi:uncharacterized membrane protein YkvA (DUF1232 family)
MRLVTEAFYRWFRNSIRNPKYRGAIVLASLLYLFSPVDLSTDLIPIVGWIDDGIILTVLTSELAQWAIDARKQRQTLAKMDDFDSEAIEVAAR